ncbi:MAG: sugar transferase [Spirochaetes bacterium]|nr:sugar transferase [Spirochaetota bacterium]
MPKLHNNRIGLTPAVDQKVDSILETAELIRKKAEEEAREIIEDANRKAGIITKNSIPHEEKGSNGKGQRQYGICDEDVFKVILQRERSRTDRNGHELSLILFDFSEEESLKSVNVLIRVLKSRARSIDRFGWYNNDTIGIILPNTPYKGGMKCAHDLYKNIITRKVSPPNFRVYSYPSKWMEKDYRRIDTNGKRDKKEYVEGIEQLFIRQLPVWKRTVDIGGSIVALILFSPFFVMIPVLIKVVSKGPVFFKQDRVGQGGRLFTFLKFRTMKANIETTAHQDYLNELIQTDKPMTKLDKHNDPRIIPLGKFIRKASIDELPQLINVLKGDMSLVGPRPCLPYEAKEYLKWHKYRFDIKPGMTGRWQVSGKNRLTFKEMIRLDIMYAKKLSLWIDLWILVMTIPTVISMIIEKFAIDAFFNKIGKKKIPEEQFKEFIKRYYSDIYNVDKLEFLDDKLKNYNIDLVDLMLLLSRLNRLSPTYNVAKRYFGICRLIDCEKKSQLNKVEQPNHS